MIPRAVAGILMVIVFAVGCSSGGGTRADGDNGTSNTGVSATDADGDLVDSDGNKLSAEEIEAASGDGENKGGPSAEAARNSESGFNESISASSQISDRRPIGIQRVQTDGSKLTVYFEMESQKCYGVDVETSETDSQIEVSLWTGLLPNVSADSCGIGVFPYQTTIDLDAPAGDRNIVAGGDSAAPDIDASPSVDDDFEAVEVELDAAGDPVPAQFVGLDIEVAIALAEDNGFKWRVTMLDGEARDDGSSNADRLSFEVKDNLVAIATWG